MGTADGIDDHDWDQVTELAVRLADAFEDSEQEEACRRELFAYLDELEKKYGPLPSILATRGDFSEDCLEKESLLTRAYAAAISAGDRKSSLYIAHSLAELYVEHLMKLDQAQEWLDRLEAHLLEVYDAAFAEDAKQFRRKLKQRYSPDRLAGS